MPATKTRKLSFFLVLCVGLGVFISPTAVAAETVLVSIQPGLDEVLDQAPTEIRLEFSSDIRSEDASISVLSVSGPGGDDAVIDGAIHVEGNIVTQPLMPNLPDGQYFVLWDVTSVDGQDLVDSYEFAVGQAGEFPEAEAVAAQPFTLSDQLEEIYDEVVVATYSVRDFLLASTILFVQTSVAVLTPLTAIVVSMWVLFSA